MKHVIGVHQDFSKLYYKMVISMSEIKCLLCGNKIDFTPGKKGRPPEFHKDCRKLWNLLPWVEELVMKIKFDAGKEKELRSRLWSMANLLNR